MSIFYTADLHLGHQNIIRFCDRPFADIEEMNHVIITNMHARVTPEDDLYILGDVGYRADNPEYLVSQLPGKKHLIIGNHDKNIRKKEICDKYFESVDQYKEISDNGRRVILFHYPIVSWNGMFRGSYHLYGHIHNRFDNPACEELAKMDHAFNVGVDLHNFFPVTLDELIARNDALG